MLDIDWDNVLENERDFIEETRTHTKPIEETPQATAGAKQSKKAVKEKTPRQKIRLIKNQIAKLEKQKQSLLDEIKRIETDELPAYEQAKRERIRANARKYNNRPEVKERHNAYRRTEEYKAKRRAVYQRQRARGYYKEYYAKNKERILEYDKKRNQDPERKRMFRERYYANREVQIERARAYYAANKEKINARYNARRRIKKAVQQIEPPLVWETLDWKSRSKLITALTEGKITAHPTAKQIRKVLGL